jgi:hypothetical protein
MANHEASSGSDNTETAGDWSRRYCRHPRATGSECWALKIQREQACLAHASDEVRQDFFERARSDPDAVDWPTAGYFCNLDIDRSLYEQIRSLLHGAAHSVDFTGSVFDTEVDFTGFEFGHACFNKVAFSAAAKFTSARFQGYASFEDTQFSQYGQSFSSAVFKGELSFACSSSANEATRAMVNLHLSLATLAEGARFDGRYFRYNVFLNDAELRGLLLFPDVKCDGNIILDRIKLTGPLTVLAPVAARVSLAELTLTQPLTITAVVEGESFKGNRLEATDITSLAKATVIAPLTIGTGITLTHCSLAGATGLENLRVTVADPRWTIFRHRRIIYDELSLWNQDREARDNPRHVEAIYRQLRAALETSKAAPAAADFYYGEMEMRRIASPRISFDRILLTAYKVISGYGLRAYRALSTYFAILLAVSLLLRYRTGWFVENASAAAGSAALTFNRFWDVFAITARSSVTFFSPVTNGLNAAGTLLFIGLRLTGPVALALAILAVRARVQR